MKKTTYVVIGLLSVFAIVIGIYSQFKKDVLGRPSVKIGLLLAQTGFGADFGQSERLVVPLLKKKYGERVQFILEDNKSDAAKGAAAAKKLIDIDNVDLIYCDLTSVANAISPLLRTSRRVLMAAVTLERLTDENPFAIRNIPNIRDEGEMLLSHFDSKYPNGRIVLIGSNDEFGRGAVSECTQLSHQYDLTLVGTDFLPDDTALISSLADRVLKLTPDGVYIGSLDARMGLLIKELRTKGFAGLILTTDAFAYDYIMNATGEASKTVVYVDFPLTEAFLQLNEEITDGQITPAAVLLYDGVCMYMDCIREATIGDQQLEIAEVSCEFQGTFGLTRLVAQEIKYPLILKNADWE